RFDRQLGQVQGLNRTNAERFSKLDLHGDVHNFGKIFADVATEKGVQQSLAQFETSTLSKSIKQAIMDAGDGGKHVVTLEEAREIAEDKIGTFLDTKKALLDGLADAEVTEPERQQIQDAILSKEWHKADGLPLLLETQRLVRDVQDHSRRSNLNGELQRFGNVGSNETRKVVREGVLQGYFKPEPGPADSELLKKFTYLQVSKFNFNDTPEEGNLMEELRAVRLGIPASSEAMHEVAAFQSDRYFGQVAGNGDGGWCGVPVTRIVTVNDNNHGILVSPLSGEELAQPFSKDRAEQLQTLSVAERQKATLFNMLIGQLDFFEGFIEDGQFHPMDNGLAFPDDLVMYGKLEQIGTRVPSMISGDGENVGENEELHNGLKEFMGQLDPEAYIEYLRQTSMDDEGRPQIPEASLQQAYMRVSTIKQAVQAGRTLASTAKLFEGRTDTLAGSDSVIVQSFNHAINSVRNASNHDSPNDVLIKANWTDFRVTFDQAVSSGLQVA
ncbi:MAG: hypothetical protein MK102_19565, partial [Fuerstiella sp.]|nr:hypothetical protein [Fuerstiella sp.]